MFVLPNDSTRISDEFSYKYIKPVYTIVLFEKSPNEFKQFGKEYFHHVKQMSDTGVNIQLLQEYYFICLDLFKEKLQNEGVTCDRDAWLAFLCEDVMGIFSEELRILDRNTAQFMIDEMKKEVDKYKLLSEERGEQLAQKDEQLAQCKEVIEKLKKQMEK